MTCLGVLVFTQTYRELLRPLLFQNQTLALQHQKEVQVHDLH